MDMASVQIFALHARDGGKIAELEDSSFDGVFEDGKLRGEWQERRKQSIKFVELRQAARRRPPSYRQDLSRTTTNLPSSENKEGFDTIMVNTLKRGRLPAVEGRQSERKKPRSCSLELFFDFRLSLAVAFCRSVPFTLSSEADYCCTVQY